MPSNDHNSWGISGDNYGYGYRCTHISWGPAVHIPCGHGPNCIECVKADAERAAAEAAKVARQCNAEHGDAQADDWLDELFPGEHDT